MLILNDVLSVLGRVQKALTVHFSSKIDGQTQKKDRKKIIKSKTQREIGMGAHLGMRARERERVV